MREQHPDAAALMILARVLSQQYLHPVLREQGGAYGGGAAYDQTTGLFRFIPTGTQSSLRRSMFFVLQAIGSTNTL